MICGPKSSGKSTFAKLLTNKILSTPANTSKFRSDENKALGVAVLDIDPGQPEYSVPGQLSLIHVYDPNFGPPYSHPIPGSSSRIIRAHSIGATTPSFDPSLYMSCVLDLFDHYRNLLSAIPTCPLIINTPGWVLGTGLEILTDLILKVRPSDIVYMSLEGPMEVVDSLREAAKTTPVSTLPSQVSEYTTRTSAHLRTMQVMSYFHLEQPAKQSISWNSSPLTSVRPWEVLYSGEQAGILGIISYGEQPPADLLLDSINGSLLAVVVVDDPSAIPGLENTGSNGTETDQRQIGTKDLELHVFSDDIQAVQTLTNPLVIRTPKEDIPYFNPENIVSVDPKHSHCIGLALVRGIDIHRRRIQLLTPLDESAIEEVEDAGKKIVLVSGKFDTPGWAFTEDLISKSWMEKAAEKLDDGDRDGGDDKKSYEDTEKGFDDTPWVEIQNGSQGRGVAGRVWRVRRDLGKTGDGG
jgi:polynucleotide 5'-hydroxyl-kinase GRC3/NOL9